MQDEELSQLETAIQQARSRVEASRDDLFEIEQFLVQARGGGHDDWVETLVERRSKLQRLLEELRLELSRNEENYRRALAN